LLIIVVSLLAFAVLRAAIINPILTAREKAMFEQAEADLKLIAEEVQEVIGKADDSAQDNTCSRPSQKYDEGPLSCSVRTSLLYRQTGVEKTNEIIKDRR
jgi:hypothetical protein